MHLEHAELIAALRAENHHLTAKLARVSELESIIEAQDRLLASADREIAGVRKLLDRQAELIREMEATLGRNVTP